LASGLNTQLFWESFKFYKSDVKKSTDVDIDWRVTTTQHRPSHIFVVFQKASKKNNQYNTNMVFDNMNLDRIRIKNT